MSGHLSWDWEGPLGHCTQRSHSQGAEEPLALAWLSLTPSAGQSWASSCREHERKPGHLDSDWLHKQW